MDRASLFFALAALLALGHAPAARGGTILFLVAENPAVLVDGAVHGSRLGVLLRRTMPHRSYTDFGYRSLAKFVEEGCGLRLHRP